MRQRKNKLIRYPHSLILVICEGKTEEMYVNLLRHHFRLPITIKTKVVGNSLSRRLVNQYLKELGMSHGECEVVYIYDGDIPEITAKIRDLAGHPIISTPCIELWFALHSKAISRSMTADGITDELSQSHNCWKKYAKGSLSADQARLLIAQTGSAVKRAKVLPWLENPSTNMYSFIELLESKKNAK